MADIIKYTFFWDYLLFSCNCASSNPSTLQIQHLFVNVFWSDVSNVHQLLLLQKKGKSPQRAPFGWIDFLFPVWGGWILSPESSLRVRPLIDQRNWKLHKIIWTYFELLQQALRSLRHTFVCSIIVSSPNVSFLTKKAMRKSYCEAQRACRPTYQIKLA